jgi:hypothetical protein
MLKEYLGYPANDVSERKILDKRYKARTRFASTLTTFEAISGWFLRIVPISFLFIA